MTVIEITKVLAFLVVDAKSRKHRLVVLRANAVCPSLTLVVVLLLLAKIHHLRIVNRPVKIRELANKVAVTVTDID